MNELRVFWTTYSFHCIKYLSWATIVCATYATFNLGRNSKEQILLTAFWIFMQLIFDFWLTKLKYKKKYSRCQFDKQKARTINDLFALDFISTIEMGLLFYLRDEFLFWLIGLFVYMSIAFIVTTYLDERIADYLTPIKINTYTPKK